MPYDLLLKGAEVIDPANDRQGVMDVAIQKGLIAAVGESLDASGSAETIDLTGKIVTPGLIDIHAHLFINSFDMGERTDELCEASGVTTVCDAGSTGTANFAGLRALISRSVRTRCKVFVHLSALGLTALSRAGELVNPKYADPEGCAKTIQQNRDLAIGVKLRFSEGVVWEYTREPLRLARLAADIANVPLMIHITQSPLPLPEILEFMKPGDIVSHCVHPGRFGIMGPNKTNILQEVWDAQKQGVIFDFCHGRSGHVNFPFLRKVLDQGFLPDVITTDLNLHNALIGPVFDLPTTMSKLLNFGVSLKDIVARVTVMPAAAIGAEGRLGTLSCGAVADLTVLELREGEFQYSDSTGNSFTGQLRLMPLMTIRDGRICYQAPQIPLSKSLYMY